MKKSFFLCGLLVFALSSCLSSDDPETTVAYQDTGLTSFSVGALKQTLQTKGSAGQDSTYTKTVAGSTYAFTIDQQQGLVYNVDSLPVNTDVSRVACTATTKNLGSIVINRRTHDGLRDSLVVYSSADSLDFTNPVEFRVYNQAGTAFRKYMVELRVHRQTADEFHWTQQSLTDEQFADLLALRQQPQNVAGVIGDDGLDAPTEWLPTSDLNVGILPTKTNDDLYLKILVGNRDAEAYPADSTAMVWCKIAELGVEGGGWFFFTPTSSNRNQLPRMKDLQMVVYDGLLVAIGGSGIGACTSAPYAKFYESKDNGLTWHSSANISFPEGFASDGKWAMVVDADKHLWLIDENSRQAWRGYLNKKKWEQE
ncbi:MAG: hypothetical protein IJ605_01600 [Prevotella sp.]|nr:hypothetical protein [Prevotella sp.]